MVGVFNRYLVERAQRETFMETRQGHLIDFFRDFRDLIMNFMHFMNFHHIQKV